MSALIRRTVRLMVDPHQRAVPTDSAGQNTFAAWPAPTHLAAWFEIIVELEGDPDPQTGYILGINHIDDAVRSCALPPLAEALRAENSSGMAAILLELTEAIESKLNRSTTALRLRLTPRHELSWVTAADSRKVDQMNDRERVLLLRNQFEFAAAHRLHCPEQDENWNQDTFGKCNNPAGHGHNYTVEVLIASPMGPDGSATLGFDQLEEVVDREVIQRFDHRHLNEDCPEFEDLNPSVENITMTCHDLLVEPIKTAGAQLRSVTVWETEKTSCTYPAEATHDT